MNKKERKRLNCQCYIAGERRLFRDGTFQYEGGFYGPVLIEEDVTFAELLGKISLCLDTCLDDKEIFCNTSRDKTRCLRVEPDDKNEVKMLFNLNENEVDLFVVDPIVIEPGIYV